MNLGLLEETKEKIVGFFLRYSHVEIDFINCIKAADKAASDVLSIYKTIISN